MTRDVGFGSSYLPPGCPTGTKRTGEYVTCAACGHEYGVVHVHERDCDAHYDEPECCPECEHVDGDPVPPKLEEPDENADAWDDGPDPIRRGEGIGHD